MALVDSTGAPISAPAPIKPASTPARPRTLGIRGDGTTAYDAASYTAPETAGWFSGLLSPDVEINFTRDVVVGRVRDLVRNDGWASGAVTRILDSVVGAEFRPIPEPNWRYLSLMTPAMDHVWADEFADAAEALWENYSNHPGKWCDAGRRHTMPQMLQIAFRQKLVDSESLACIQWMPERRGYGRADYATALRLIDTDRLSNPQLQIDTLHMRAGVEIDDNDAALAYHIRRAHQGDWFAAADSVIWDRIPRETDFGRPIIVHDFDAERPNQHRGSGGIFAPILARMKMLSSFDAAELAAAVVNSVFAAYIETSADVDAVQDALSAPDANAGNKYAPMTDKRLKVGDGVLPVLRPGEKLVSVDSKRPSSGYATFEAAVLRNCASAIGTSYEQLSQDWSKVNYSSARAALLEAWKTLTRRRKDFGTGFSTPIYSAWLEEAIDRGELPLPARAPDFAEARGAYSACQWMGPPRGWIDPVKEAQAAVLRMDAGLSTLRQECAEQGLQWKKVLAQRAIERSRFKELNLPYPTWFGVAQPEDATEAATKPQAE
jgi:lambda family phage portal protein